MDGAILVVDDDPHVRSLVALLLREEHYTVLEASDPHAGRKVLEANADTIALVISDYQMVGKENGVNFLQSARAITACPVGVILISGYVPDLPENIPLLHKPFRSHELLERVRKVLNNG